MKKIVLVILLVLPLTASAQWPLDPMIDSMAQAIYQQLGSSTDGTNLLTTARVFSAINRALNRTCTQLPAYEKVVKLVVPKDSVLGTSLPSDFHRVKDAFRVFGDSLRIPLIPIDPDSLRSNYGSISSNLESTTDLTEPSHYYTFGKRWYFHPKYRSTTADTVLIHYYAMDVKLETGDSLQIMEEYYDAVFNLACSYLSATQLKFSAADWYMREYERMKEPTKPREVELKQ